MVIEKFQRMGHFCCFQLHFFHLLKAKMGKYKKIDGKWLFIPFFGYNLANNQLPNTFLSKIWRIFIFDPPNVKHLQFSAKKGLSNLIQALIINKTCWFLAYLQHLEIKKSCRDWIFEFFIFLRFCCFLAQKNG